ncbi:uncharacterized protein LOC120086988 [Benincasa hispida]|uniref:uncharacterized protein LOC120086988 n=1 Tax=Benincasa hispida TaxID=102211 RepID=UPI001900772B|nr:uncharacterized protein LOC120086988 [Benincasa hispida]XP_038899757.1 uncharacterized protein LOC120086988 [Benincasa hispida]
MSKEEDTEKMSKEDLEGTPCHLTIGTVDNIVAVATTFDDDVSCLTVKVLTDIVIREDLPIPILVKGKIEFLKQAMRNFVKLPRELVVMVDEKKDHSPIKSFSQSSKYTNANGTIKLLNGHAMHNMNDVDMIRISLDE